LLVFEQLAQKPFEMKTLTDTYLFFYSMLLASNPDCGITFDAFIEACESDADLPKAFGAQLEAATSVNSQFPKEKPSGVKKKRVK
jgi:hypothetical protein